MATVTKIGLAEHGRRMTLSEFLAGDYEEGYHYELINGRLFVSPEANLPQDWVNVWVYEKLLLYSKAHRRVINYVTPKARVFVPAIRAVTAPEPDLAAYRGFPINVPARKLRWQNVSPILVVEVLSEDDAAKDQIRNVVLYREVPSIKEYWILDGRQDADKPTMTVYRRRGQGWRKPIEAGPGERYTTPLLPDFELVLDTRS
jgi:Uma2 family endonuclease